jgi:hypothetical protein
MDISKLELLFLQAGQESVFHQQELMRMLAEMWQVPLEAVLYQWMTAKRASSGTIRQTDWRYFFHGLECDFKDSRDGRFVRAEFGPGGRCDIFSGWSVSQFIMTTKAPWGEYPELQTYLATKERPFNELSGDHRKMADLFDRLAVKGLLERVAPELDVIKQQYTHGDAEGPQITTLPPEYTDFKQPIFWDIMLSNRWVLSVAGKQLLQVEQEP